MKLQKSILCGSLLMCLFGCQKEPEIRNALQDGIYEATQKGYGGDLTMEAEVSGSMIRKLVVKEHHETAALSDYAIEKIPAMIVENQSIQIDVSTGATMTSKAVLACAEDLIQQANGDVTAWRQPLKKQPKEKAVSEETEVVVVGGGASGIAAALRLNQAGIETMIVEKSPSLTGGLQYHLCQTQIYPEQDDTTFYLEEEHPQSRIFNENLYDTIQWQKNDLGIAFNEYNDDVSQLHATTSTLLEKEVQASNVDVLLETCVYDIQMDENNQPVVYAKSSDGTMYEIQCAYVVVACGSAIGKEPLSAGVITNTNDLGYLFETDGKDTILNADCCLQLSQSRAVDVSDAVEIARQAGIYSFVSEGESYLFMSQRAYRKWKDTILEKDFLTEEEKAFIKNGESEDITSGKNAEEIIANTKLSYNLSPMISWYDSPCYLIHLKKAPYETTGSYRVDDQLHLYLNDSEVTQTIFGVGSCVNPFLDGQEHPGILNAWAFVSGKYVGDEIVEMMAE